MGVNRTNEGTAYVREKGDPEKIYSALVQYRGCHKSVAIPRRYCERSETTPPDWHACAPQNFSVQARRPAKAGPLTMTGAGHYDKRSWLSDLLLSLPQSLYGKTNTFLHSADGVG